MLVPRTLAVCLGCGLAAGSSPTIEDATILLQQHGATQSLPASLQSVETALSQVDPDDVLQVVGGLAKVAGHQMEQWEAMAKSYLGGPRPAVTVHPDSELPVYGKPAPGTEQQPAVGQPAADGFQTPAMYGSMPSQPSMGFGGMQSGPGGFFMPPATFGGSDPQSRAQAAKEAAEATMMEGLAKVKARSKRRLRDLAFVHVPVNFGHDVERDALMAEEVEGDLYSNPYATAAAMYMGGDSVVTKELKSLTMVQGPGGEAWGKMDPALRELSPKTGCDLYATPPKYWPKVVARKYFRYDQYQNKTVFGLLRDPYDRIVHEFRLQSQGFDSLFNNETRKVISEREGTMDRESEKYQSFYDDCNVSAWVKAELGRFQKGDRFRGNCHLLPQKYYFDGVHGIQVPIDNRHIPQSFNEVMKNHGYDIRMATDDTLANLKCDVSAWSLDEEAKALVREVYADDFALLCQHFGYCDNTELTCLKQFPRMCSGSPYEDK